MVNPETALSLGGAKYAIKLFIAAFDTPFIYWGSRWNMADRDWQQNEAGELLGMG